MHRTVGEEHVGAAGVEAVDFVVVRAVDGTRPAAEAAIGLRTLDVEPVADSRPGAANDRLIRTCLPCPPVSWPAGTFGPALPFASLNSGSALCFSWRPSTTSRAPS